MGNFPRVKNLASNFPRVKILQATFHQRTLSHLLTLQGQNSPQQRFVIQPDHDSDSEDQDEAEDDLEDEDELEDEFDDYGNAYHAQGLNTRIITTVPAKEPVYNAVPLKSALKKSKGGNNFVSASAASQQPPSKSNETQTSSR